MKPLSPSLPIFLLVLTGITIGYWSGVKSVPFHPDESTFLFLSSDLETLTHDPASLAWRAENQADPRQRYWLLDAPAGRYLVGLSRWMAGQSALPVDWDWSASWQENQQAGALPSPELLLAGRMGIAFLFPFSILFLFLAARLITNDFTAWVAALLLASNALVLLHTRRAMSEGVLLFTSCLLLWSLVRSEKRPWLTALPAAIAMAAKHSLAALAPAALLAVCWPAYGQPRPARITVLLRQVFLFGGLFILLIFLLNPFLWHQPSMAFQAAMQARQDLVQAQTGDRPEQSLNTPARRLIGLIGSIYLTPPMLKEVGNYQAETMASEEAYLANPLHTLFRSIPAGGLLMIISLTGFAGGALKVPRPGASNRRGLALFLLATLLQGLALLVLTPLPWQRYYMPLIPLSCFWTAYGIDYFRRAIRLPRPARVSANLQQN